jgi:glyoxylase-like metal-dependent hydrolase (beta-lactamase superfamily II)
VKESGIPFLTLLLAFYLTAANGQTSSSAGLDSYFKAKKALDAGVKAIGGEDALRSLKVVRRELAGDWFGSGQSQRPHPTKVPTLSPPPTFQHAKVSSWIDYSQDRWFEQSIDYDDFGDAVTRAQAVTSKNGFETITYQREKPFHRASPSHDLLGLLTVKQRRYPEGLLLMSLKRPTALRWVGEAIEFNRKQDVISLSDPLGTVVLLYFDASTHLLTKSETLRSHPIAGDSYAEIIYQDYRRVGDLKLPFRYVDRAAGVPTEDMRASVIEVNTAFPEDRLRPPDVFVEVNEDPSEQTVHKLGDGVYLLRGRYNCMFVVFQDHVVVFEAPLNSQYTRKSLELIRATVPDKPVRYVVSTHFHYDHVAGMRPYVARSIPVLAPPDAKGSIEGVVSASHTMQPDELSLQPKPVRVETVADRKILDDGTNRVELYNVGPTQHVSQLLVAYFPKAKVLFVADIWDILSNEFAIAGADAAALSRKIQELRLDVERIVPVHGAPATIQRLNEAVAIRSKYFK